MMSAFSCNSHAPDRGKANAGTGDFHVNSVRERAGITPEEREWIFFSDRILDNADNPHMTKGHAVSYLDPDLPQVMVSGRCGLRSLYS